VHEAAKRLPGRPKAVVNKSEYSSAHFATLVFDTERHRDAALQLIKDDPILLFGTDFGPVTAKAKP
jgi:hypothetical protein